MSTSLRKTNHLIPWLVTLSLVLAGCMHQIDRNATRKSAVDLIARLGVPEADILSEVDGGTVAGGETWITFYFITHDDPDDFENKLVTEAKVKRQNPRWSEGRFDELNTTRLMINGVQAINRKTDDIVIRAIEWLPPTIIDGKRVRITYFDLSKQTVLVDGKPITGTIASITASI